MVVSGHGGYLTFFADEDAFLLDDPTRIDLGAWSGNWTCDYMPSTPAGAGGGTLVLPKIGTHTWQVTFPLDDDQFDDVDVSAKLQPGMVLYAAIFIRGNEEALGGAVADQLERTTVTGVQMVDDNQGDALRVVVTGSGGFLTQGVVI